MEAINSKLTFKNIDEMMTYGYDLTNNVFVNVDDCVSGLGCNLVCKFCKNNLIAKKGNYREHHFAHQNGSDCVKGHEETIPLTIIKLLKENKRIYLPIKHGLDGHFYNVINTELEEVPFDHSFNVLVSVEDGRTICLVAYVKSSNASTRRNEARARYDYVLVIDLERYKGSNNSVEDIIKKHLLTSQTIAYWEKHKEGDELDKADFEKAKAERDKLIRSQHNMPHVQSRIIVQNRVPVQTQSVKTPVIKNGFKYYYIKELIKLHIDKEVLIVESLEHSQKYKVDKTTILEEYPKGFKLSDERYNTISEVIPAKHLWRLVTES